MSAPKDSRFLSPQPPHTGSENALDGLIAAPPASLFKIVARCIMLLLATFILWAMFANLEEVAVAEGEVAPVEQVQSIQHLEGGIIEEIYAFEGDVVTKGQPLVKLNVSAFTANREELEITQQSLLIKKERLRREAAGEDNLTFSKALEAYRPALLKAEAQVFEGRQQELASRFNLLKEQEQQRELDIKQLESERNSVSRNLNLLRQKLKISSDLVKDKLTSQLDHLQLKGEVEELEGRLKIINISIPRAQAALAEARERLRNERLIFRNDALKELNDVEAEIARTQEMLSRATDQVTRTTITSPINGVIKSLKTRTIGGVLQAGEVIMEIVPTSANLLIEARLNPRDIGFVKKGQDALVKFLTYDYARYGGLQGKVISVSADTHSDPKTGESYFLVKIRTDHNFLGNEATNFPITTGMQATTEIHTGKKTVMEYILKPVIKVTNESFRER
ncbi:MAG: HlyD family type I secretion periplasmic adaptor subunit [Alphaproteobacteria bacterium]|nr:HlyD family type I secretion periplasmic adaptor subunit [Alphaproteobacteria bacterium]